MNTRCMGADAGASGGRHQAERKAHSAINAHSATVPATPWPSICPRPLTMLPCG